MTLPGKLNEGLAYPVANYLQPEKFKVPSDTFYKWQSIGYTTKPVDYTFMFNSQDKPLDAISEDEQAMASIRSLPGVMELAGHPERSNVTMKILDIIVELNDRYRWSREAIADWLETLDVDLRFETPDSQIGNKKRR